MRSSLAGVLLGSGLTACSTGAVVAGHPVGACDADHGTGTESARATVRCYLDSLGRGDFTTVCDLVTARARTEASRDGRSDRASCVRANDRAWRDLASARRREVAAQASSVIVREVRVDGGHADVRLQVTEGPHPGPVTVGLVRQGGRWHLDTGVVTS